MALVSSAQQAIKNTLSNMAKTLAPRLAGQSQKAIERTLADWSDTVVKLTDSAVKKVKGTRKI